MNNYSFQFADSYLGFWNIPKIGRKIPGTLLPKEYKKEEKACFPNSSYYRSHI